MIIVPTAAGPSKVGKSRPQQPDAQWLQMAQAFQSQQAEMREPPKVLDPTTKPWEALTDKEKGGLLRDAYPALGGDPGLKDRANFEEMLNDSGTVRFNPSQPGAKEYLKNLPPDVERYDLKEFGPGHENNTTILRKKVKRMAPLTS